jgi:hypothetical protein
MTTVFITSAATSPWSLPGDWVNAGHQVELIGCGGNGNGGGTGANSSGSAGGGGGAYYKLTAPSGTLGGTTPFAVKANNTVNSNDTNATFWEGTTTTNTYEARCGTSASQTVTAAAGVTNGTPSPVTYTAASNASTGYSLGLANNLSSGAGGCAAGGPDGVGAAGGGIIAGPGGSGSGGGGASGGSTGTNGTIGAGGAGGNGSVGSGGGTGTTALTGTPIW